MLGIQVALYSLMKSIYSIVESIVIAGVFVLAVEVGVAADVWPAFDVTGLDAPDELVFAGLLLLIRCGDCSTRAYGVDVASLT
jgi:hypothetical protein